MNTKKEEKDRYKEQILHRSHFIPVSVHTTEIKMSCQEELRTEKKIEKKTEKDIGKDIQNWSFFMWKRENWSSLLKIAPFY